MFRERISRVVELGSNELVKGERIWKPKRITDTVAKAVLARGNWPGVSSLNAVIEAPAFLPSGEVLQKPGYDKESRLHYNPTTEFKPVADKPTKTDAQKSLDRIEDVVCDFPFKNEAHRSVFVAAILTCFSRQAFEGSTPLFFIDGNNKGVGKTLLADTLALIISGRPIAKASYPSGDEEMTKQLVSIARAGLPMFLMDNVPNNRGFGYASLDSAITSGRLQGRTLGKIRNA